MGKNSKIQWTNHTWNPVTGCSKVSAGCKNCYAETFIEKFQGRSPAFPDGFRVTPKPHQLVEPLGWEGMVFVNSLSDLFHEDVPFDYISAVFGVMVACPNCQFQILTKRPARMLEWFAHYEQSRNPMRYRYPELMEHAACTVQDAGHEKMSNRLFKAANNWKPGKWPEWPLANVWLGVSVEDDRVKDRIDLLRQAPAAVRFVSFEPLIGHVGLLELEGIHWAIIGGESGPGARPMSLSDARHLVGQCEAAGVKVFVKQMGVVWGQQNSATDKRHGGNPEEWPMCLRVREFPTTEKQKVGRP